MKKVEFSCDKCKKKLKAEKIPGDPLADNPILLRVMGNHYLFSNKDKHLCVKCWRKVEKFIHE